MGEYLIFVMNAVNGVHLNLCVKKFKKNEKITVLGSVYIAAVNELFHTSVQFYTVISVLSYTGCLILTSA